MEIVALNAHGSTASVKETLADLVKIVEEKNLVGLAFAVVERDGTAGSGFSDTPQAPALVGGLEFLQRRIMNSTS